VFRGGAGLRRLVLSTGLAHARRHCHLWASPGGDRQGQRTDCSRNFDVTWKDLHHRSSEFHNAPMPYSVFFNGGDAFHEGSVTVRSNGCVHLTQPAAQTFYNTLHVGDEVQVVG
jgi:hypothetical protein